MTSTIKTSPTTWESISARSCHRLARSDFEIDVVCSLSLSLFFFITLHRYRRSTVFNTASCRRVEAGKVVGGNGRVRTTLTLARESLLTSTTSSPWPRRLLGRPSFVDAATRSPLRLRTTTPQSLCRVVNRPTRRSWPAQVGFDGHAADTCVMDRREQVKETPL